MAAKCPCAVMLRVINAADIVADDTVAKLGLGEPVAISAETGEGFSFFTLLLLYSFTLSLFCQCREHLVRSALQTGWVVVSLVARSRSSWQSRCRAPCHGRPLPFPVPTRGLTSGLPQCLLEDWHMHCTDSRGSKSMPGKPVPWDLPSQHGMLLPLLCHHQPGQCLVGLVEQQCTGLHAKPMQQGS